MTQVMITVGSPWTIKVTRLPGSHFVEFEWIPLASKQRIFSYSRQSTFPYIELRLENNLYQ